jgi:nicotinamidase-related amidase
MSAALLIIDVQQALVDDLPPARRAELFAVLASLLERARATRRPVVFVRDRSVNPGTPGFEIPSEIAPLQGEPIVDKDFGDAFQETELAGVLAGVDVDHVVAAGMQTDFCVDATVRGARERGYRVTLVADGHATYASEGRSEEQIREGVHREALARGAEIVPAADLFA